MLTFLLELRRLECPTDGRENFDATPSSPRAENLSLDESDSFFCRVGGLVSVDDVNVAGIMNGSPPGKIVFADRGRLDPPAPTVAILSSSSVDESELPWAWLDVAGTDASFGLSRIDLLSVGACLHAHEELHDVLSVQVNVQVVLGDVLADLLALLGRDNVVPMLLHVLYES